MGSVKYRIGSRTTGVRLAIGAFPIPMGLTTFKALDDRLLTVVTVPREHAYDFLCRLRDIGFTGFSFERWSGVGWDTVQLSEEIDGFTPPPIDDLLTQEE